MMSFCHTCGTAVTDDAKFCTNCGGNLSAAAAAATAGGSGLLTAPARGPLWFVTHATGKTDGPYTEEEVRARIARQEIRVTDSIATQGSTRWLPITQSPFASHVAVRSGMDRLASGTCPRCGSAMAVVLRRSSTSKGFLIAGCVTFWMFGFGFLLLIVGYILGRNRVPRYECPRCRYKAG